MATALTVTLILYNPIRRSSLSFTFPLGRANCASVCIINSELVYTLRRTVMRIHIKHITLASKEMEEMGYHPFCDEGLRSRSLAARLTSLLHTWRRYEVVVFVFFILPRVTASTTTLSIRTWNAICQQLRALESCQCADIASSVFVCYGFSINKLIAGGRCALAFWFISDCLAVNYEGLWDKICKITVFIGSVMNVYFFEVRFDTPTLHSIKKFNKPLTLQLHQSTLHSRERHLAKQPAWPRARAYSEKKTSWASSKCARGPEKIRAWPNANACRARARRRRLWNGLSLSLSLSLSCTYIPPERAWHVVVWVMFRRSGASGVCTLFICFIK